MGNAALHPIDTLSTMYNVLSDSFINDVINGDAESRAKWGSYALTQVGLGLIGDKGLSKASKLGQVGKVTKLTKNKIQQSVSHITSNLQMGDRFAYVSESGMRFGSDMPDFRQVEEKLSTHQFAKGEGGSVKGANNASEISKLTKEQLATKPSYSRDPVKWMKKGGKIEIDTEGVWTYTDWEIPPNKVTYTDGFPDFKSAGMVKQEVPIGKFKKYDQDFAIADELAPNGPKLDENTWHHHQDLTTMQEVNKKMHRRFTHMGGMSLSKKLKD
ncbi:Putative toxin component near putative ESAT-related protein, repetitive [Bacillus mycoides]|nr:Putative toxin component near putative ESAT-related protein, repetitive [Bacillus mycoides]